MSTPENEKLVFTCPECKAGLQTKRIMSGKEAECPKCREKITIPDAD